MKGARKVRIKGMQKSEIIIESLNLALDSLNVPETETIVLYPYGTSKVIKRSLGKVPKGFSFAMIAEEGWELDKQRPETLAVYIVEQFKEHIKREQK